MSVRYLYCSAIACGKHTGNRQDTIRYVLISKETHCGVPPQVTSIPTREADAHLAFIHSPALHCQKTR